MLTDWELEDREEEIDELDTTVDELDTTADELIRLETDPPPLEPPPLPHAVINDTAPKNINVLISFILTLTSIYIFFCFDFNVVA
jgi:hypothetical protein